jgi:outer membrane protein assembly factor BamB
VDGHGPGDAYLACVELATGRERWRTQPRWEETVETRDGPRAWRTGIYCGSLLLVDGSCLCLGGFGHLLWLDPNPEGYRELARARLFSADQTWTPPVVSRGLLYVMQNTRDPFAGTPSRLLCYDLRAPAPGQ